MNTVAILYPGCIEFEIQHAAHLLAKRGTVFFATPDGQDHLSKSGLVTKADFSFATVNTDDISVLLIPGGDPRSLVGCQKISRLVQKVHDRGTIIGAICAGPFILAQAGVLKGKRIAHGYEKEQLDFLAPYFSGVTLTDELIQTDGNIVTAKPSAYAEFALELERLAK